MQNFTHLFGTTDAAARSDQREEEKQTVIFEFGFHRAHSDPLSISFGKSSFIHSHPYIHSLIHHIILLLSAKQSIDESTL